ncbi:pyruvate formate-lyase-activating protein [Clostridium sp. JN-1]|uniref:pyruvate formate-lyase-activating protein n=1 Tax=Clostridium sp. JN-1 TaxID=2483110 RepID=UPI000F0BAB95|nr:pyruvate formate-lyase-activating protein [Clostridium sp. JN-1]
MGNIHSIESMGLVDGPGIRVVIFFQGCSIRCAFCHNPETWKLNSGIHISADELLKKVERFKVYFEKSNGGVTCSGGEPLMQPEFLIDFLKLCKANNIHTAVDTAGFGIGMYDEILKYTDLVILDVKSIDDNGYKSLTGKGISEFLNFVKAVNNSNSRIWLRHVMVPGITDSKECMDKLVSLIKEYIDLSKVDKFEILPYHTLGLDKYRNLKIDYKLEGIKDMDKDTALEFEKYVIKKLYI